MIFSVDLQDKTYESSLTYTLHIVCKNLIQLNVHNYKSFTLKNFVNTH